MIGTEGRRLPRFSRTSADDAAPTLAPPDPVIRWIAEIQWHEADGQASFRVEARSGGGQPVLIAESTPLDWPPSDTGSVTALRETTELLAESLVAAGWEPLPDGSAWYAKRFAWAPVAPSGHKPAPPGPGPAARTYPRLPWSHPSWPDGTEAMWRCEIVWAEGYVRSSFRVVVYAPGKRRGRTIAESEAFKWMLNAPPNQHSAEQVAEARRLTAALASAGWEHTEAGPDWYASRFVWRRPGAPPQKLPLSPMSDGAPRE